MPTIYDIPAFPIAKQIFHVPGASVMGGFTSGGAQLITPDPAGYSRLEFQPALQTSEWLSPISSWLMSKTNGELLRIRLAPTPQVSYSRRRDGYQNLSWQDGVLWAGDVEWTGDISLTFDSASLESSNTVVVDTTATGPILAVGHVIGHGDYTYKIDNISYAGALATITTRPPLRQAVAADDVCYLRPYFVGRILNGGEIIQTYDAENNGHIQLPKVVLGEAIV